MGKRNRQYSDKRPFHSLRPDPRHWTRKGCSFRQKVAYRSEDDAYEFLNQNPRLKSMGYTVYQCPICSLFHVGRFH